MAPTRRKPSAPSRPEAIRPVLRSKHIFMIVYGNPGVGKTRLIGQNARTLILRPPTDHTDSIRTGDAQEWVMNDWGDMTEALEYLRMGGAAEWDWVWLDSISLFQDHGLDSIWEDTIADKPHRAKYGLDKGEYGVNMFRLGGWVRHMVSMDLVNFGIVAHAAEIDNLVPDVSIIGPYVQGKNMVSKVSGYMNLVAYYEVKESKGKTVRVLRTQLTEDYYAKDQFDAFGEDGKMVAPTMPKIVAAIETARSGETASKTRRAPARRRTTTRGGQ